MNRAVKRLMIGSVPAFVGTAGSLALAERQSWPVTQEPQPSFQASTQAKPQPAAAVENPRLEVIIISGMRR